MKNKKVKLSIIVPNYNNEQYFERLFDCLIKQSYEEIEIIVVNDGSQNDCDNLIKKYKKNDKRIKYVKHKTNKGLFQARLTGADLATGDYIAFLDADDYVSLDYYRTLINNACENNSDIVIGNTVLEYLEKERYEYPLQRMNFSELTGKDILNNYFDQRGYNYSWYTIWNKIYSMKIWRKARKEYNNIKTKLTLTEDMVFSTVLFYYAKKVTKVENDAIFYCQNDSSITDVTNITVSKEEKNIDDMVTSFNFIESFMKKENIYNKYKECYHDWRKAFATNHKQIIIDSDKLKRKEKTKLLESLKKLSDEYYNRDMLSYFSSIRTEWNDILEDIKRRMLDDDIKYVSFDVFDTLLLRPFYYPTDMFRMLDKYFIEISKNNSIAFSKMRTESEIATRVNKQNSKDEDVTLDEIYETMIAIYNSGEAIDNDIFMKMKEKEIENEIYYSQVRKTAYELYQLALYKKKKVFCISDMYLPKSVIQKMLKKNGYDIDNIFVSSEIMKTKATGTLYKYVIDKLGINPEEVIHIGDSYMSDYVNPQKYKINAVHLIKTTDALHNANNLEKMLTNCLPFWKDNRGSMSFLGVRNMLAVVANKYFDNPFRSFNARTDFNADPYLVGYYALGMYNYAITRWLLDNTNGENDVLAFMARDGYLSMETYEILKELYDKPPKSIYMYVSRKSLIPVLIKNKFDFYKLTDILQFANTNPKKVLKYLKSVIDVSNEKVKKMCLKENIGFEENFKSIREFNRYLSLLANNYFDENKHKETRDKLKKYFNDMLGKKPAVFDVGYSGRPEYYLSELCNKKMDTYFLNVNCDEAQEYSNIGKFKLKTFFAAKPTLTGNAYELLLSKISPSCIDYDISKDEVKPVFEEFKSNYIVDYVVDTMQKAAIEFTKDLYNIFKEDLNLLYYQDYYLALPIMAYFNSGEKLDQEILGSVIFEDDIGFGLDRKMIEDMYKEGQSKNQRVLGELLNIPSHENYNSPTLIYDKNLIYNRAVLSEQGKLSRMMYYALFDKKTLKRRVKEIKGRISRKRK